MKPEHLKTLMEVLSLSSSPCEEDEVRQYIHKYCDSIGVATYVDDIGNVYAQKGELNKAEYYPMVCAHIDTVHEIEPKKLKRNGDIITAFNPETNNQIGLGADDLSGVALCLIMLSHFDKIKCTFYVGEETYCVGSKYSVINESTWYQDIGYCVEFDSPGGEISRFSDTLPLFIIESDFHKTLDDKLKKHFEFEIKYKNHPWSDIYFIKKTFDFSCLNMTCGYYNYHTEREYLDLIEWGNSLECSKDLIASLGLAKYIFTDYDPIIKISDKLIRLKPYKGLSDRL